MDPTRSTAIIKLNQMTETTYVNGERDLYELNFPRFASLFFFAVRIEYDATAMTIHVYWMVIGDRT